MRAAIATSEKMKSKMKSAVKLLTCSLLVRMVAARTSAPKKPMLIMTMTATMKVS